MRDQKKIQRHLKTLLEGGDEKAWMVMLGYLSRQNTDLKMHRQDRIEAFLLWLRSEAKQGDAEISAAIQELGPHLLSAHESLEKAFDGMHEDMQEMLALYSEFETIGDQHRMAIGSIAVAEEEAAERARLARRAALDNAAMD